MTRTGPTLGKKQIGVLSALINHGRWHRGPTCGWSWSTESETERVLASTKMKPFVTRSEERRAFAGQVTVFRPDLAAIAGCSSLPDELRQQAEALLLNRQDGEND